jgi:hypothetical protein
MATDEELAEQVLNLPESDRKAVWGRLHRDYSPEVEMLSALFDRLGELIRVTAATRGARGKQPQNAPRPTSAIERVRRRRSLEKHQRLTGRVLRRNPPPAG